MIVKDDVIEVKNSYFGPHGRGVGDLLLSHPLWGHAPQELGTWLVLPSSKARLHLKEQSKIWISKGKENEEVPS